MDRFNWLFAMIKTNFKASISDKGSFLIVAFFMAANNLIWFVLWIMFFRVAGEINGWGLQDVARMFGLTAFAYGLAFVCFGGAWRMSRLIIDGQLDVHLARPRSPLVSLIFSRAEPEAFGDILSGIVLLVLMGNLSPAAFVGALAMGSMVAAIVASIAIIVHSMVFWSDGRKGVVDQIYEIFICFSTMPQHGLPTFVKVILFTILPAGFVAFLPIDIIRDFSVWKVLAMVGAAIVFPALSVWVFHLGLQRYTSGNRIVENR